ncbi:hypothetical protein Glove_166g151 [Diversispora epigaea]|uniref:Uncharacterized protein n=1 Tax=Diversispora epigaea TaxID=1348612 RepID=A0A397IU15_9GLOM|nr:hypothetical protein Glove_166g151 [Diversispora epigaea]
MRFLLTIEQIYILYKTMANPQSENNSLRALNSKLVVEITELRKKYAKIEAKKGELEIKNAEISELRREKDLLMARIIELERSAKENAENEKQSRIKIPSLRVESRN